MGWRLDGSAVGAGPTGGNFGSPGHAPRYDRGIGSAAVRMRSVLQPTTGPCPSHPTATEGQRAQGVEPQTGLQHGAGPRSRERVSTPGGTANPSGLVLQNPSQKSLRFWNPFYRVLAFRKP